MKIRESILILTIMGVLAACGSGDVHQDNTGESTDSLAVETPAGRMENISEETDNDPDSFSETDEPSSNYIYAGGPYGELSINLSDGWTADIAPVDSDKLMYGLYGIILKPEGEKGQIELFCIDGFGVCGTGLEETEITLAGDTALVGTYDEHEHWDFIVVKRGNPEIVAQHTDCDSWSEQMWDQALAILDTFTFDEEKTEGGIGQYIPESENDTIAVIMSVTNVTPSGLNVHFRQYDTSKNSEFIYGESYKLQVLNGDTWEDVPPIIDNGGFNDIGYILPAGGEATMETDWEWLYGRLAPGTYRITKSILDGDRTAHVNIPIYFLTAQFIIAEE